MPAREDDNAHRCINARFKKANQQARALRLAA
jgi:hypothetical protein